MYQVLQPSPGAPRVKADSRPTVMTARKCARTSAPIFSPRLQACSGKVFGPGGAAEMLDIKPTTLASRIKALGIANARGLAG